MAPQLSPIFKNLATDETLASRRCQLKARRRHGVKEKACRRKPESEAEKRQVSSTVGKANFADRGGCSGGFDFFDLGSLALQATQIVKLGSANFTSLGHLDLVNNRRVQREDSLYTLAK